MTRHRLPILALALAAALPAAGSNAFSGSIFRAPEPEIVYGGAARDAEPGVVVLREEASYRAAASILDPELAGEMPDLSKRTVLRVVGRRREDLCRETVLREVSTRNSRATIRLEERSAETGCHCGSASRPPAAWLVTVSRAVRRATIEVQETVLSCDDARRNAASDGPVMLLEGSWDETPGARLIREPAEYRQVLSALRLTDRGPDVDFENHAIAVVTGRPRGNGCRKTTAISAATGQGAEDELIVTLEEEYPPPHHACTQVYRLPRVFLYRVPVSVTSVRVVMKELRPLK